MASRRNKILKVAHVIPRDGIGGVEIAARSALSATPDNVDFRLIFLAGESCIQSEYAIGSNYESENNPLAHISILYKLFMLNPDVVICSLWRTAIVGVIYKTLRPKTKLVCFLHLSTCVHVFDRIFNYFLMAWSSMIWADSLDTLQKRIPRILGRKPQHVVSFVTEHLPEGPVHRPSPVFVFWGRLHRQKGIDRSLDLFKLITNLYPDGMFYIIGPDDGELALLKIQVEKSGLSENVSFVGPASLESIIDIAKEASFYLQLSRTEGMAMSVVEAMQLGLVPVVTPVGEIGNYCVDNINSIIYRKDSNTTLEVIAEVMGDSERYYKMRSAAIEHWRYAPLYRTDIFEAISIVGE